jgi:hypothetical protein
VMTDEQLTKLIKQLGRIEGSLDFMAIVAVVLCVIECVKV